MKKQEKNSFIKSIFIVILSFIFFVLIILLQIKINEYKKSLIKIDVIFNNSVIITINNKLPISDALGKTFKEKRESTHVEGYSSFTIKNPNEKKITYEIYLTKRVLESNEINPNYIKLYLTDKNDKPYAGFDTNSVPSYGSLYALSDRPGSRLLYRDSLVSGATAEFKLRSWLSDTYVVSTNSEDFIYDISVRVK